MKKLVLNKTSWVLPALLVFSLTSCLKDKGFDKGEYGAINSNVEGGEWISIPRAANTINTLGVESRSGNQTVGTFVVSYDYKDPASQDITATLALNNQLVTDYNTANAATPGFAPVVMLPTNAYSLPSLNITVPAGQRVSAPFPIVMNTSLLDPSKQYGIGFTIASVSKTGVGIPTNLKNVVYVFSIKNKYDGIYSFTATYDHPADRDPAWRRDQWTYAFDTRLITTGPNSVSFYNDAFAGTFLPLMTPGASGFGGTALDIVFDAADKVVSVNNPTPDSRNRQFTLIPGGNSRYDAASKTLFLEMTMGQNGFAPIPMHIKMVFTKPRP